MLEAFLKVSLSPFGSLYNYFQGLVWSTVAVCVPFFYATIQRSPSNNLSFGRLPSSSPLNALLATSLITAGVRPKRFHSHNDSSRKVPLYHALSLGAGSVESDVRVVNGVLLSGWSNDPTITLESAYVRPLEALLDVWNPKGATKIRGVYDVAPDLPLQLMIDIKSDVNVAFPMIHAALEPLRQKGYLTTHSTTTHTTTFSAITVIITTHADVLPLVSALSPTRDMFLDAPLLSLTTNKALTKDVALTAHAAWYKLFGETWKVGETQRETVRRLVGEAHERGLMVRFWGIPNRPVWLRNRIWAVLLEEGVDWLNADDIDAAAAF